MDGAGEFVHDMVEKPVRGFYGALHKSPGAVIIILLLGTLLSANIQLISSTKLTVMLKFISPMERESKFTLEVREGWSTDIVMLYIHTENAIDGPGRGLVRPSMIANTTSHMSTY